MKWVNRIFAGSIGLLALGVIATGLLIGFIAWAPTPIWDQWDSIAPEQMAGKLFAPHNEHRIIMSRLVFWADIALAHGVGVVSLAFVYIYNAAHLVLLILLARWTWPQADLARFISAAAVAAVFFFSGFQFENFVSGFQNAFTGVFFFSSAAIVSLCVAAQREDRWRQVLIALSAILAVIAVGSMANGLLVLPLLVVLALLLGLRASAWIMAALTVVSWLLYFREFPVGDGPGLLSRLTSDPVAFIGNVLAYAGGAAPSSIAVLAEPFAQKLMLARAFGAVAMLTVGVLIVVALRKPLKERPQFAAWAAIGLFIFASAAVTALGRTGFGELSMLSNRYGAATAPLWSVVAICLIMSARGPLLSLSLVVASALTLVLARTQLEWMYAAQLYKYRKMDAEAALLSGAETPAAYSNVYHDPNKAPRTAQLLRERSLAMFYEPWRKLYGRQIKPASEACAGEVIETGLLPAASDPTWRVSAYGEVPSGAKAIAVTDEQNTVVGFLVRGTSSDKASWLLETEARPRWSGFVRMETKRNARLSLSPVDVDGHALCRLDDGIDIDTTTIVRLVSDRLVGAPVPAPAQASVSGIFPPGGHYPSVGKNPWGGQSWGSWGGDEKHTGSITIVANVEGISRVAVPIVTGPTTSEQYFEARVDGVSVMNLPAPAELFSWSAIEIPIPSGGKMLEIIARDASSDWGTWIAVGEPHLICEGRCEERPCPAAILPDEIAHELSGGFVDMIKAEGDGLLIVGWAGDVRAKEPVDHIAVAVDGAVIACQRPDLPRPDVADSLNAPALNRAGFSLTVKSTDASRLQVYARQGNGAFAPLKLPSQ